MREDTSLLSKGAASALVVSFPGIGVFALLFC